MNFNFIRLAVVLLVAFGNMGFLYPQSANNVIPKKLDQEMYGLAVAGDGTCYVSCRTGGLISIKNLQGEGLAVFGEYGFGPGQIRSSLGIALDRNNNILFADEKNSKLVLVDSFKEKYLAEYHFTEGDEFTLGIRGLHIGSDNRIYIADEAKHRIIRMDDIFGANPVFFGSLGKGVGQFTAPAGITTDRLGRIYITDTGNGRIVRLDDFTGKGWVEFGTKGKGINQFQSPYFSAIDNNGRIIISDGIGGRLVRIDDITGAGWVTWSAPVLENGKRMFPTGLYINADNQILFVDQNTASLCKIDDMDGSHFTYFRFQE